MKRLIKNARRPLTARERADHVMSMYPRLTLLGLHAQIQLQIQQAVRAEKARASYKRRHEYDGDTVPP